MAFLFASPLTFNLVLSLTKLIWIKSWVFLTKGMFCYSSFHWFYQTALFCHFIFVQYWTFLVLDYFLSFLPSCQGSCLIRDCVQTYHREYCTFLSTFVYSHNCCYVHSFLLYFQFLLARFLHLSIFYNCLHFIYCDCSCAVEDLAISHPDFWNAVVQDFFNKSLFCVHCLTLCICGI